MSNENDDILEGIDLLFNIQKTANDYRLNQQKLSQTMESKGILELNKQIASQNAANLTVSKELLKDDMEDNEAETKILFNNIKQYGVNVEDWLTVDDKYQTKGPDGANKLLDDLGLELGKNLQVRVKYDKEAQVNLDRMTNRINVQREINDGLQGKVDEITNLWGDLENVGTDLDFKGIKTKEDIKAYIFKNREKFGIDENIDFENIDWANDVNHLARAFLKKRTNADSVGFYADPTTAQMDAAGLSTDTDSYGRPIQEVKDEDIALNLNQDFANIKKTMGDISTDEIDDDEIRVKYSKWLEKLNLDNFMDLKGTGKMWDKGKGPLDLKAELENIILSIVKEGTEVPYFHRLGAGGSHSPDKSKDIRNTALLIPISDDGKDDPLTPSVNEATDLRASQPLNRYKAVKNLYERWVESGVRTGQYNEDGKEIVFPRTKIEGLRGGGGFLNKEYADDQMISGKKAPKGGYGTGNEDKLLYQFIKMWKNIDDYHPTTDRFESQN